MKLNIDKALSVPNGLSLDDLVGIFGGDEDPRLIDSGVPLSSLYLRTNGEVWQKVGWPSEWLMNKPGYKAGQIPIETYGGEVLGVQIQDTTFSVELSDGTVGTIN